MDNFRLKPDEMMFFIDFNNTLVDFENEFDAKWMYDEQRYIYNFRDTRVRLSRALTDFRSLTGIKPVICVVTNAYSWTVDQNQTSGIFNDLFKTFFENDHISNMSEEQVKRYYEKSCEQYFKYLIYRDNDAFYKIDPFANNLERTYKKIQFDDSAMQIRLCPEFKKRESVERMLSVVDPKRNTSRFMIFAGDKIKDDYPMKEIETPDGVSKIFIRPYKAKKITHELMREFAEAKGETFTKISTKTGRKLKTIDQFNFSELPEKEQQQLKNFDSGDIVLLTQKNNRGLVDGIYESAKIIASQKSGGQLGE